MLRGLSRLARSARRRGTVLRCPSTARRSRKSSLTSASGKEFNFGLQITLQASLKKARSRVWGCPAADERRLEDRQHHGRHRDERERRRRVERAGPAPGGLRVHAKGGDVRRLRRARRRLLLAAPADDAHGVRRVPGRAHRRGPAPRRARRRVPGPRARRGRAPPRRRRCGRGARRPRPRARGRRRRGRRRGRLPAAGRAAGPAARGLPRGARGVGRGARRRRRPLVLAPGPRGKRNLQPSTSTCARRGERVQP